MATYGNVLGRANWSAGNRRLSHSRPVQVGMDAIDEEAARVGAAYRRRPKTNSDDVPVNALARRRRH